MYGTTPVFTGVVEIETVSMQEFSYAVCSSCMRRPGSNKNCADCGENGGSGAAPLSSAFRLRVQVRADDALVSAILFDGAARRLLGYTAENMERFISASMEACGPDAGAQRVPESGDARAFVESAVCGTVVLCELEDRGGTDVSMKILRILSDTPYHRMSAVVDRVLSSKKPTGKC